LPQPLARLRYDLDFLPSPVEDRPGLLIRDPLHYSDAALLIPPALVRCLDLFDGAKTELDLRERLTRLTGEIETSGVARSLIGALAQSGFLHDEAFENMRTRRRADFARAPVRQAAHAGGAYPEELDALRALMARYLDSGESGDPSARASLGIAAPHASPEGGWQSYQAAYRALPPEAADRTFVILGTSHFGEPERFGLTRKSFATPLGESAVDQEMFSWLERKAAPAVAVEDYCHAVEHSIEFQVLFLQQIYGPDIKILPVLCGPFAKSIKNGGLPEEDENVSRFFDALGELGELHAGKLLWVLGVDMAHMGRRYHDGFDAFAGQGKMEETGGRDRERIGRLLEGDAEGFWSLVRENEDDLKWCGSAPLYTFLRCARPRSGRLLRYEQWNIDPESVVTFAGLSFSR
jgi:MEMO1 family protein